MRLAMRALFVLALPGVVFGFLTQIPPLKFKPVEFGLLAPDTAWLDVLAALVLVGGVALVVAIVAAVLLLLGVGSEPRLSSASRPDRPTRT